MIWFGFSGVMLRDRSLFVGGKWSGICSYGMQRCCFFWWKMNSHTKNATENTAWFWCMFRAAPSSKFQLPHWIKFSNFWVQTFLSLTLTVTLRFVWEWGGSRDSTCGLQIIHQCTLSSVITAWSETQTTTLSLYSVSLFSPSLSLSRARSLSLSLFCYCYRSTSM